MARPDRWLRVDAVAKRCGVTQRTVRHWAEAGILPAYKRGPKLWAFRELDVDAFLESGNDEHLPQSRGHDIYFSEASEMCGSDIKDTTAVAQIRSVTTGSGCGLGSRRGMVMASSVNVGHPNDSASFGACFLAIVGCILKNSARLELANSPVNFHVSGNCRVRLGVEEGYNFLCRHQTPRCLIDIGDLTIRNPSRNLSAWDDVGPELREWVVTSAQGEPREVSGTLSGIPVWAYRFVPVRSNDKSGPFALPNRQIQLLL